MNAAQVQQLFRTPAMAAAAVTRARQDDHDAALLHSLALTTADPESWPHLRNAGVVALFLDIILRMPERTAPSSTAMPLWAVPLQGLFNSMVGIQRTPGAFKVPEGRDAAVKMLEEAPAICRRLYDDKQKLCGSEAHAEDLRRFVAMWIQATWNGAPMLELADVQSELKASHVVESAARCWVFATSTELQTRASTSLQEILTQPQPTQTELDQVIAAAGSYEKLISTSKTALQSPETVDGLLASHMGLLTALTGQTSHVELSRRYAMMKTHHDVLTAVRRQLSRPVAGEEYWSVLEYSGMLLVNIVNEAPSPTEELTALIEQHSLIPLLGGIMLRCAQASRQSPSWTSLAALLKHTCTCQSPTCRVRTSPAYTAALRTHLARRWWATLPRLRGSAELGNAWLALGRAAGLAETADEVPAGGCWWAECVRDVSDGALRRCSACKRATYCTAECQNRDWKGHKKLCAGAKTLDGV